LQGLTATCTDCGKIRGDFVDLNEYQEKSKKTDMGTVIKDSSIAYYTLGLCDEAGEVAGKVKKLYRDYDGKLSEEYKEEIKKELGDVMWYLSQLCTKMGIKLEDVAKGNIEKLYSRLERGQIKGKGDNR
jgi:NTP pyrophosphatase (non-canonical NTP hydrolase)